LDNLIYKDYAAWRLENQRVLETFQENQNVIYSRLEPIYAVLNHIYDMVCNEDEMDEDLETIFEVGFQYLSSQFEVIKIYFQTLFNNNCDDFEDYSTLLLYLIYILDIRNDMENNGFDSDIEILDHCEETIENMIMERSTDFAYASTLMNDTLKEVFKLMNYEYVGIIDIFVEIAENLGIFLYEDDEFLIGKEV
jgi:hypothetical protein